MKNRRLSVGIVGATGALGRELISLLEERSFPFGKVHLYASAASAGAEMLVGDVVVRVEALTEAGPAAVDVCFFLAGAQVSALHAGEAAARGAAVFDLSAWGRARPEVRLIVPELNGRQVDPDHLLYASPSDNVTPLALVLGGLADQVRRVSVTSLEPASGEGQRGMEALSREILRLYRQGDIHAPNAEEGEAQVVDEEFTSPHPYQLAFNAIPRIGSMEADGSTAAERGVRDQLLRLLGGDLECHVTCVRVPWFSCHGFSVHIDLAAPRTLDEVKERLRATPGVEVVDEGEGDEPAMPFNTTGRDEVRISRLRLLDAEGRSVGMFVVSDNLRKGTALNLVQTAELWAQRASGA